MTFEEICEHVPRLAEMRLEARAVKDDVPDQAYFCANLVWYERFKPELVFLVGWHAQKDKPNFIYTPQAYSCAYDTIYDELPNCRKCNCA